MVEKRKSPIFTGSMSDSFDSNILLYEILKARIQEWYNLAIELHQYYKCHRCADPMCCKIPVQITDDEVRNLSIAMFKTEPMFIREYVDITKMGKYLKNPCPFLTKGKKSGCDIHYARPFMCRMYPFSSMPGVLLNIDVCPLAADIATDLDKVSEKAIAENYKPENTELDEIAAEAVEKVREAAPMLGFEAEEHQSAVETMFNMIGEMAPESTLGDEPHTSIKVGVPIFALLLEEKKNERK